MCGCGGAKGGFFGVGVNWGLHGNSVGVFFFPVLKGENDIVVEALGNKGKRSSVVWFADYVSKKNSELVSPKKVCRAGVLLALASEVVAAGSTRLRRREERACSSRGGHLSRVLVLGV